MRREFARWLTELALVVGVNGLAGSFQCFFAQILRYFGGLFSLFTTTSNSASL
jgi:hypothetical protein